MAENYVRMLKNITPEMDIFPPQMFDPTAWEESIIRLSHHPNKRSEILKRVDLWGYYFTVIQIMTANPATYDKDEFNRCIVSMLPTWSLFIGKGSN
jgi:hypothetical protein